MDHLFTDVYNALDEMYDNLINGLATSKQAAELILTKDVQKVINSFVNKHHINPLIPYFEQDIQVINKLIEILQFIYNNSGVNPPVSDATYDKLYEIMLHYGGSDIISAPIMIGRATEEHKYTELRGSLDKVYYLELSEKRTNPSRKYLDEWIKSATEKIFKATGRRVDLNEEEVYIFPKWDGVSIVFEVDKNGDVERALTRGDVGTNRALNVLHVLRKFRPIPEYSSEYGLKTEIMMREEDLSYYNDKYKTTYKNTRSIVSAILNSLDTDERTKLLKVQELRVKTKNSEEVLAKGAFNQPYLRCLLRHRDAIRKFAESHKEIDGLRCDGAVIYIINPEIQRILGREENINKFEVAYKFTEESAKTRIIGVEFTVGLFGRITPVAYVEKVKLKGNTITNISLGSIGRFNEMKLAEGDEVKILYDIIPYLIVDGECRTSGKKPFKAPKKCPICGDVLELSENDNLLTCMNDGCECRIKGKILNYLNKLDIKNISYAVVDRLYSEGFLKTIPDLYELKKYTHALQNLDGFGITSVSNILKEIDEKRTLYDYQLFGAIGIPGISDKIFKKVFREHNYDEVIAICKGASHYFTHIPGIKDKTSLKITNGVLANIDMIQLLYNELNVMDFVGDEESSFSACFTNIRDSELEEFIKEYGGEIDDSLTKTTSFLVVPNLNTESTKVEKAKKYEIPIIPIDDVRRYVSDKYSV